MRQAGDAVAGADREKARIDGRGDHGRGTADEPGRGGLLRAGGRARAGLAQRTAPDAHPLGFSTRTQLVAWAYESGLLPKDT